MPSARAPEFGEVERKQLDRDVPAREHGRQLAGWEVSVGATDDEMQAAGTFERLEVKAARETWILEADK